MHNVFCFVFLHKISYFKQIKYSKKYYNIPSHILTFYIFLQIFPSNARINCYKFPSMTHLCALFAAGIFATRKNWRRTSSSSCKKDLRPTARGPGFAINFLHTLRPGMREGQNKGLKPGPTRLGLQFFRMRIISIIQIIRSSSNCVFCSTSSLFFFISFIFDMIFPLAP